MAKTAVEEAVTKNEKFIAQSIRELVTNLGVSETEIRRVCEQAINDSRG